MPINIEMPRLSDTMQAGTVVKWNVKEGQKVKSGDALADIETDKATMELQSFEDGTVASIAVAEGQNVPIGTVILVLAAPGEDLAAAKGGGGAAAAPAKKQAQEGGQAAASANGPAKGATATMVPPAAQAPDEGSNGHAPGRNGGTGGRIFASPLAKKIAAESNVDLGSLQGSGPGGRIIRKDVEAAVGSGGGQMAPGRAAGANVQAPSKPLQPLARTQVNQPSRPAPMAMLSGGGGGLVARVVPLSNMRKTIAKRLVESKTTIPHYQVTVEASMDALMELRTQLNEQLANQGVKLSVNDFLVRASALAMHQHPYVNTKWAGTPGNEAIEYLPDVNVGVAIALPVMEDGTGGGLVVATIRNADVLGLRQISAETKRLSEKARTKGLSVEEMSDATFTISNLGMFGVESFTAIINPPNTAILAAGGAVQKAVVKNGQVVPGHVMSMTMSSDHRVIDGAMAANYLNTVKGLLEKPATLLV
ncbi:MAG: 2-oxo acid dehydrogenase subunit E2 [Phycisphaeraceae bacterium]|nr:2-oxo acid dehydrogenase subunit E2 [Phycisphaeraceae bacterium]